MSEPIGWNVYVAGQHLDGTSWHRFHEFIPNEPVLGEVVSRFADEVEVSAREALVLGPVCGAVLFPLPPNVYRLFALEAGEPVSPAFAAYCGKDVYGPAPLSCAREPHPDSPWHWNGKGTWWR